MEWIANNIGTIFAALILLGIVCAIIIKMVRDRKKGKLSCSCNCAHCAMSSRFSK